MGSLRAGVTLCYVNLSLVMNVRKVMLTFSLRIYINTKS
jgi:hypothetical protein